MSHANRHLGGPGEVVPQYYLHYCIWTGLNPSRFSNVEQIGILVNELMYFIFCCVRCILQTSFM